MSSNQADSENGGDTPPLARGWAWARIGQICDLINGRAFKTTEWSSTGLPIIRIQNLNDHNAGFNYCEFEIDDKYIVENGQLLFAWSGTPGTSFGTHIWNQGRAVLNQHIFKVQIVEEFLDKHYLVHLLNHKVEEYIRQAHGSAGLAHITKSRFEGSLIPIAPLSEQHRVADKIEELFTQLDAGVAALQKAKAQLRRYRQAVLNAAVTGELTREWRAAHRDEVEPAASLLERIKTERRAKLGEKYKEPAPLDTESLPELPAGWVWTSIGEMGEVTGGVTKNPDRMKYPQQLPYLSVANVYANELRLDDIKSIGVTAGELERVLLQTGDLLVVEGNGSPDQIGRVAIWDGNLSPCVHQNHIIKVRFNPVDIGEFVLYWLLSDRGRTKITDVASSTSGLYTLSLSKVSDLPVPVPSLAEQHAICEEVDRRVSVADALETAVMQSLRRAARLRQSILQRAFSGALVPQDPNDEPASVLLERIRTVRTQPVTPAETPRQLELFGNV